MQPNKRESIFDKKKKSNGIETQNGKQNYNSNPGNDTQIYHINL